MINNPTPDSEVIEWVLNGSVSTGTEQDGLRVMDRPGSIGTIIVSAGDRGNTGTNLFDVNKHVPAKPITTQRNATAGVTIYTTQANRPDLDGLSASATDNAIKQAVAPNVTSFLAGDFFSMDVDTAFAQLSDVVVQMTVTYN